MGSSSESESYLTKLIISETFFCTGTFFSFLNVLVILLNSPEMLRNIYTRQMFLIQLLLFIACAVNTPIYASKLACQITGAIFYDLYLMSILFTQIMMLLILADLTNKRQKFKKMQRWLVIGVVTFSTVVAFTPIQYYGQCDIDGYPFYCGYCFSEVNLGIQILLFYIVPSFFGIILSLQLWRVKSKLQYHLSKYQELTDNQKQALRLTYLPFLSVVFIVVNLITYIIGAYSNINANSAAISYLLMMLNSVIFLIPLVNFIFFLRFEKWQKITQVKVKRCRWLFGLKGKYQDDEQIGKYQKKLEEELSTIQGRRP